MKTLMKRIIIILLCLLPMTAWGMNAAIVGGGGNGTTYIYSGGTTATGSLAPTLTYAVGSDIAGQDVSIKSLGFYLYTIGVSTECKLALLPGGPGLAVVSVKTLSSLAVGWNDVTFSPVSISSGTTYRVGVSCNGSDWAAGTNASSVGRYCTETNYAGFTTTCAVDGVYWSSSPYTYMTRVGY